MSKNKPDRRIEKTKSSLAQSLFKLMQQKAWNSISIQELCDEANVARASFYGHFDSKLALLDFLIAEVFERQINSNATPKESKVYIGFLMWLVDHVSSSRALFSKIAKEREALPVLDRFKRALLRKLAEALRSDGVRIDDAAVTFVIGGIFDCLLNWAKSWRVTELTNLRIRILEMAHLILEPP